MGEQVAKGILGKNIIDIIDLDSEYSVVEIPAPKEWTGKTLIDLNLRRKYGINVIGIRNHVTGDLNVCPEPECTIEKDDHIVLIADGDAINKFDNMID